jgi:hypothetical protein
MFFFFGDLSEINILGVELAMVLWYHVQPTLKKIKIKIKSLGSNQPTLFDHLSFFPFIILSKFSNFLID